MLGIVLAVLAAYQVPSLTPRGSETWSSESSLLVTQSGFPEGRHASRDGPAERRRPSGGGGQLEFADPDRLSALASLYAQLATGDRVRSAAARAAEGLQIEATPVEGNASTQLPVIKLTTTAGSGAAGAGAQRAHGGRRSQNVLTTEQAKNDIPAGQRIRLDPINAPAKPVMTAGRSHTASILAFLLCVLGAVALAHLLAALRDGREDMEASGGRRRALGGRRPRLAPGRGSRHGGRADARRPR